MIPFSVLSYRAQRALYNRDVPITKRAARKAIRTGLLKPGYGYRYGVKLHEEVCLWAGVPFERKKTKKDWKFDPFTGQPITSNQLST